MASSVEEKFKETIEIVFEDRWKDCTDPQKLDQNLTIRRSVFLWQNIVLNSRRKSF